MPLVLTAYEKNLKKLKEPKNEIFLDLGIN